MHRLAELTRLCPVFGYRAANANDTAKSSCCGYFLAPHTLVQCNIRVGVLMDEDGVRRLIADHLGVAPALVLDPVQFRALGADSLDLVSLTMRLEEALDLHISDDQAERCLSVGDAMQLVRISLQNPADDVGIS